jgi:hypothetical protein
VPVTTKWHPVDAAAAEKLAQATSAPGTVFQMATSHLPQSLQQLPGAVSYFVSGYASPQDLGSVGVGGEILLARTEGQTTKNYQWAFATSADGAVCIAGPYKAFPDHHVTASSAVPLSSLFGHTPFKKP